MLTNRFDELNWLTKKKTNENKRILVNYTEKLDYRITSIDDIRDSKPLTKLLELVTVKKLLVEIKSLQNDEQ